MPMSWAEGGRAVRCSPGRALEGQERLLLEKSRRSWGKLAAGNRALQTNRRGWESGKLAGGGGEPGLTYWPCHSSAAGKFLRSPKSPLFPVRGNEATEARTSLRGTVGLKCTGGAHEVYLSWRSEVAGDEH